MRTSACLLWCCVIGAAADPCRADIFFMEISTPIGGGAFLIGPGYGQDGYGFHVTFGPDLVAGISGGQYALGGNPLDLMGLPLDEGDPIDADLPSFGAPAELAEFPLFEPKYLGFRADHEDGDFGYGWLRIERTGATTGLLLGLAFEVTPGTTILAGQVPGPGTAGALALGAAVALRRRRAR